MKKYITQIYGMAGTVEKADRDFANFAEAVGWEIIPISRYNDGPETEKEIRGRMDGIFARLKRGDVVVHQYPTWNSTRVERNILKRLRAFGVTVGIMVHDIPNWVNGPSKWNSTFPQDFAQEFDFMIVHTDRMADKFRELGYDKPIFTNVFFDYSSDVALQEMAYIPQVYTAGNPRKASKLLAWDNDTPLIMYGNMPEYVRDNTTGRNIDYRGSVPADLLPLEFKGGFGLVFYQDIPEDDNWSARYAIINGPHKLSSYLAAGLPVIVESYMPSVPFIVKHKLGFAIDDITQVDEKIAAITEKDYREMANNAAKFAELLRTGYFTKRVMSEVAAFAFTQNQDNYPEIKF